jgi:hypothetical protein
MFPQIGYVTRFEQQGGHYECASLRSQFPFFLV